MARSRAFGRFGEIPVYPFSGRGGGRARFNLLTFRPTAAATSCGFRAFLYIPFSHPRAITL